MDARANERAHGGADPHRHDLPLLRLAPLTVRRSILSGSYQCGAQGRGGDERRLGFRGRLTQRF
jgi:hypothetical protein